MKARAYIKALPDPEFGMSDQSAANFMNVARRFDGQIPNDLEFKPTILYALAAPSTPDELVDDVVERAPWRRFRVRPQFEDEQLSRAR